MQRLARRIIDADLKHREPLFQFGSPALGSFLGTELGLDATIDLKGVTGRWFVFGSERHVPSPVGISSIHSGYGESGHSGKFNERWTMRPPLRADSAADANRASLLNTEHALQSHNDFTEDGRFAIKHHRRRFTP
ncbi:hypothetical protein [Bradyrhizobium sp. dw_78]|uniref:hypothetical protein n=1 Tax=Bradyrhizobium sp. dw_78 TaxID=2719793 RepID=UPI001BD5E5C9|nr:hypothetical protein [Bradyrhizobium sp. dw_78]